MARSKPDAAGGFPAIAYSLQKAREAGGVRALASRLLSKNTCKTCALGMGGQRGGMRNELGRFPEVCKKSIQATTADMVGPLDPDYLATTPISALGRLSPKEMEDLGRITHPLIAEEGDKFFRSISWDEALDRAGLALRESKPEESFFYVSGRSSNEAAFLLQLTARAYGSANIHNCSFYCHQASGVGLSMVYGSGTSSVQLEDLDNADFAMVIGANPASNHPRLMRSLLDLRRRGGSVLSVNPLKELGLERFRIPSDPRSLLFGSEISSLYLQPGIGGDIALLKAMLKGVIERGAVEREFVQKWTGGFEDVEADIRAADWGELLAACGVSRSEVDEAVTLLCKAKRGIVLWAMGLTHHAHGVDNILALANLTLARGWLGRPGSGMLPIRGHSNVQGVGSMGVTPALKDGFARKLEELYDIHVPAIGGQDTYASMQAAERGDIRVAIQLGGNLWGSNPDLEWAGRALRTIDLTVHVSTKLNPGHVHGRGKCALILPALARDEESQSTTQESMFSYVRLSDGGDPAVEGLLRSEVDIVASLAERVLPKGRFDWAQLHSHEALRRGMARVVPGYTPVADIGTTQAEFQIPGRTFHEPYFATDDKRARFHVTAVPDMALDPDEFLLMTIRSEGQFNTVVYEEYDLYRGADRRDAVLMSAIDASRLGVEDGQRVKLSSKAGEMDASVCIVDIAAGSMAAYFPEANILVERRLDRRSKTPAFKATRIRVHAL